MHYLINLIIYTHVRHKDTYTPRWDSEKPGYQVWIMLITQSSECWSWPHTHTHTKELIVLKLENSWSWVLHQDYSQCQCASPAETLMSVIWSLVSCLSSFKNGMMPAHNHNKSKFTQGLSTLANISGLNLEYCSYTWLSHTWPFSGVGLRGACIPLPSWSACYKIL